VTAVELSIVTPVYNEASILEKLVRRCSDAARQTGLRYEIIIVDDHSTDDSERILNELRTAYGLRLLRFERNQGQFRATQAGIKIAEGEWILVLDGDLQDPPETIGPLVEAFRNAKPKVEAAFAVKSGRHDPVCFKAGLWLYHRLRKLGRGTDLPAEAGSFCVMRRRIARQAAEAPFTHVNLNAVLETMNVSFVTVSYVKQARYDGRSRLGWRRLILEAFNSLLLSGALARAGVLLSGVLLAGGVLAIFSSPFPANLPLAGGILVAGVLVAIAVFGFERKAGPIRTTLKQIGRSEGESTR